jgi:uncharacterized protein (TIGR02466 family)
MTAFIENSTSIIGAFPIPILLQNLNRDLTEEENKFFKIKKKDFNKNISNINSNDHYILENPEMKQLKSNILEGVNNYFQNIVCPPEKTVEPYITQSWLNWTTKNEYHHKHNHANSYISGVLYIDVDEKVDSINFYNEPYQMIKIDNNPKKNNVFNTNILNISIKKNLLVLFPSSLSHSVNMKDTENIRTSLAFNTFIRGTWGNNHGLTELII